MSTNESEEDVYFNELNILHTRGRLLEEARYYPDGLQMAGISSLAFDRPYAKEGYQSDFSDYEEDYGYNEFQLRDYDPQLGRWTSTDPYDQFASPYMGMGNDWANNVDPDGGSIESLLTNMFIGAMVGTVSGAVVGVATGDEDNLHKYMIGGAIAGMAAGAAIDIAGLDLGQALKISGSWAVDVAEVVVSRQTDKPPVFSNNSGDGNSDFQGSQDPQPSAWKKIRDNFPLPYKRKPDRTPARKNVPVDDSNPSSFKYPDQCSIRVSVALRKAGYSLKGVKQRTYKGYPVYGNGNVLAANNLKEKVKDHFGKPEKYDGTKDDVMAKLNGRTGIIFFADFPLGDQPLPWTPATPRGGFHIDLYDGSEIMSGQMYQMKLSKTVLFWPLN